MSKLQQVLIYLISIIVVGSLVFVIYQQNEISKRQLSIEAQVVKQKELADSIVRSQSEYATKKDIEKFIVSNGVNIKAIQDDLDKLHGEINAVNVIVAQSSSQNGSNIPSSGTGNDNPNPTTEDKYGYLKKTQLLSLDEKFGKINVPFGQVGFSAWQEAPWNTNIYSRNYKIVNVIGTDENQMTYVYNKVTINVNNKDYDIKIASAETKQEYPDAKWTFWNPKLFLAINGGVSLQVVNNTQVPVVTGQFTPSLSFGFISYGRYLKNPDFSFLQIGVGLGLIDKKPQFVITPIAYSLGRHIGFLGNTYIAPSIGIGTGGAITIMGGIGVSL